MNRRKKIYQLMQIITGLALAAAVVILLSAAGKMHQNRLLQGEPVIQIDYDEGLFFVEENEIKQIISQQFPRGLHNVQRSDVQLAKIEDNIAEHPYVKEVDASLTLEGQLTVRIHQRVPILRVINRAGVSYYLDEGGEKIPVTANFTSRVPVITGFVADNGKVTGKMESKDLVMVHTLVQHLRSDPFFDALVEQVFITRQKHMHLVPKVERHTILLGDLTSIEKKLQRLKWFYLKGLPKVGWKDYTTIDVRFADQIVAKK